MAVMLTKICAVRCWFDGSCEPFNPGGETRFGWIIRDEAENIVACHSGYVGRGDGMTNNVGEFAGLLDLLRFLDDHQIDNTEIFGDSTLVINIAAGKWKAKKPHLKPYAIECKNLLKNNQLCWIPREENAEADALSKNTQSKFPDFRQPSIPSTPPPIGQRELPLKMSG